MVDKPIAGERMACKHYNFFLTEDHRHHIPDDQYNNCVLCISEDKGPMTQEEIGKYLNLTKMRISQIEKIAIKKIKNTSEDYSLLFKDTSI